MRRIFVILVICLAVFSAYILIHQQNKPITIGIVVPIQHRAMDEIVRGFSQTLSQNFHEPYTLKVENAQNDTNLQRAIFQKMKDAHYNMIVPIGTTATQMAVSMIHEQPIVSLAADFDEAARKKLKICNIAVIHDEIPPAKMMPVIHEMYPELKNLTLIHSAEDKVIRDVAQTLEAGLQNGITVTHVMVTSLPELMGAAQSLSSSTQGIFILKDNLIASGIATLAHVAAQKNIPLIASDEGSVEGGAYFSLGVKESQIGVEGAVLAAKILHGASACDMPIAEMTGLSLFVNNNVPSMQNIDKNGVKDIALKHGYKIELTTSYQIEKK